MKLSIVFDKPDKVYHPGQKVSGEVQLTVNSVVRTKSIKIKFMGKAECKWIKSTLPVTHEIYFKNEQILGTENDEYHNLPIGEYFYPFGVTLPKKIPSSYSGSHGAITYFGKAKIETPYSIFNKKEKVEFFVVNFLNLNFYSFLRTPSRKEDNKTFWSPHRSVSSSLSIVANLPKNGYTPSESIPITLEVKNASDVEINAIYVYLIRIIQWKVNGKYTIKNENKKLQKTRLNGVPRRQSYTFNENLTIPSTTYPSLTWCSVIEIYHKLKIRADVSGMHSDLKMHIPITIGNIPFSENSSAVESIATSKKKIKDKVGIEMSLEKISKIPLFPTLSYSKLRLNSSDPEPESLHK